MKRGRKRIGITKRISITLPDEDWAILLREPSFSEGIRTAVDAWRGKPERKPCGCAVDSTWCTHEEE